MNLYLLKKNGCLVVVENQKQRVNTSQVSHLPNYGFLPTENLLFGCPAP